MLKHNPLDMNNIFDQGVHAGRRQAISDYLWEKFQAIAKNDHRNRFCGEFLSGYNEGRESVLNQFRQLFTTATENNYSLED